MTHLTINQVCELTTQYRQGVCVPELAKKFNTDYETVIKFGRGGKSTVFDRDGKVLFTGYKIDCEEYCDKHPKKWGSMTSRTIDW
jgi:hypothetical protein